LASVQLLVNLNLDYAWAATIQCPTGPAFRCIGTGDADDMRGTLNPNTMEGRRGDDSMNGLSGNDKMYGDIPIPFDTDLRTDNDGMNGGTGSDLMQGGRGDDKIVGGTGNDFISGFNDINLAPNPILGDDDEIRGNTGSDRIQGNGGTGDDIIYHYTGSAHSDLNQDTISCGTGQDEAFINISNDGDTAMNDCEIVHTE
jgi:Ca2+-binding RTX toxin-like protein